MTEAEARAAYPPNCERCVWLGSILGLMRCLRCSVVAMTAKERV